MSRVALEGRLLLLVGAVVFLLVATAVVGSTAALVDGLTEQIEPLVRAGYLQ